MALASFESKRHERSCVVASSLDGMQGAGCCRDSSQESCMSCSRDKASWNYSNNEQFPSCVATVGRRCLYDEGAGVTRAHSSCMGEDGGGPSRRGARIGSGCLGAGVEGVGRRGTVLVVVWFSVV